MTKQSVQEFSTTAASNTDIAGINVNTGWSPANVGPAFRTLMAMLAALAQPVSIALSGSSLTLTAAQASSQNITFTGSLSGSFTVTLPANPTFGLATNSTNEPVVLTTGSGTTLTMTAGSVYSYLCDGTNVTGVQSVTSQANPGDLRFTTALTTPTLWYRCYGQAVSRTTYSALFAAITFATTGTTASASNQLTDVAALPPNMDAQIGGVLIEGTGIPTGTTVSSITGSGPYTITLSANATVSGSTTVQFLPYGQGDGSTTFNLPDMRGRIPLGADAMGGTAASRVTSAVSGVAGNVVGGSGGDQHAQQDTITAASTLSVSATTTLTDHGHVHNNEVAGVAGINGAGAGPGSSFQYGSGANTSVSTTGITASTTVSGSVATTATSSLTGNSQNMPPVLVGTWIIYAGV